MERSKIWLAPVSGLWKALGVCGALALAGCASPSVKKFTRLDKARALVDAAAASIKDADYTGAFQFLKQAEDLESDLPELHHTRAVVYYTQKQFDLAIESARKSVSLSEEFRDGWTTLGRIQMEIGKFQDAEASLQKAVEDLSFRDVFKGFTNLGILHYRQGDFAKAEDAFQRSMRIDPLRSCYAHYYMGHIQLKRGDLIAATDSYRRAAERLCSGFQDAHLAHGIVLQRRKEFGKAREKFIELAKLFPNTEVAREAALRLRSLR
jgi:Tfp pilus assembly protein PilF